MTYAQSQALSVLAVGEPVTVTNMTDYDERMVHWRPAMWAVHAGYARHLAGPDDGDEMLHRIEITEDGMTAARAANVV